MGNARVNQPLIDRIATLRTEVGRLEADWRRLRLPPPTRAAPLPDQEGLRVARLFEECGRRLDLIGGQIRNALRAAGGTDPGSDEAMLAHADFLLALTGSGTTLDPDQLLASILHLRDLSQRRTARTG